MMAKDFSDRIAAWTIKVKERSDEVVRSVILDVGSRLIYRSPVDTGRFRANWRYDLGNITVNRAALAKVDPDGEATLGQLLEQLPKKAWGYRHFITNNLPYAIRLEYGYSKQQPAGMVRRTVREFASIASDAAKDPAP